MTTFEAITHIRHESLSRTEAMRYLVEHFGFSTTYADELVDIVFSDGSKHKADAQCCGQHLS